MLLENAFVGGLGVDIMPLLQFGRRSLQTSLTVHQEV